MSPPRSLVAVLLLGLLPVAATARELAEAAARRIAMALNKCFKAQRCGINACASNGGLRSCCYDAESRWEAALSRVEGMIAKRDAWCGKYWAELKDAQEQFGERALQVPSIGDGPCNTNDDLALILYQQKYELACSVLGNSACRPAPSAAPAPSGKPRLKRGDGRV